MGSGDCRLWKAVGCHEWRCWQTPRMPAPLQRCWDASTQCGLRRADEAGRAACLGCHEWPCWQTPRLRLPSPRCWNASAECGLWHADEASRAAGLGCHEWPCWQTPRLPPPHQQCWDASAQCGLRRFDEAGRAACLGCHEWPCWQTHRLPAPSPRCWDAAAQCVLEALTRPAEPPALAAISGRVGRRLGCLLHFSGAGMPLRNACCRALTRPAEPPALAAPSNCGFLTVCVAEPSNCSCSCSLCKRIAMCSTPQPRGSSRRWAKVIGVPRQDARHIDVRPCLGAKVFPGLRVLQASGCSHEQICASQTCNHLASGLHELYFHLQNCCLQTCDGRIMA